MNVVTFISIVVDLGLNGKGINVLCDISASFNVYYFVLLCLMMQYCMLCQGIRVHITLCNALLRLCESFRKLCNILCDSMRSMLVYKIKKIRWLHNHYEM